MNISSAEFPSSTHDSAMLCRAAYEAPPTADAEVMYMPAGLQTITPSQGGRGVTVQVRVDRAAAQALEAQRAALEARGKRPYFDFNHEDGEASFWPTKFLWVDGKSETGDLSSYSELRSSAAKPPGIYARGEWSDLGSQAIAGKRYRQFSPVFYVDDVRAQPARIICREDAKPNMGGLVNDPAFHTILPFWAKDAGAPGSHTPTNQPGLRPNLYNKMTHEEIAGLRARMNSLEQQSTTLDTGDDVSRLAHQAELKAARAELAAGEAQRQAEALRARNEALEVADLQRRQATARQYAADMVARGALAARDHVGIAEVERNMATSPEVFAPIYARWSSNPALSGGSALSASARYTAGGVRITNHDPRTVFGALGALCARQSDASLHVLTRMEISREFGSIYAREFRGENGRRLLDAPLMGADSMDPNSNHLGTLAGSLVTQRTLELLRLQFPVLSRVATDFSDLPAQFNQTIVSRTIGIPTAQDYSPSGGWPDDAPMTFDVPVTINKHKGVPITFNQNLLASTVRRLFDEFAPASSYALAKAMVDDLYANITDYNFPNNTVQATVGTPSFSRNTVIDMGTALTLRGVPQGESNRTLLLYPSVFAQLAKDSNLVTFAAFQRPELFEAGRDGVSPGFAFPVHGFDVQESSNLLTNNGNITGFGFSRSALVLAARVPNDYASVLPGASYGNVQVITDPDLGLSVMLVQYVDHKMGTATQRIALMYGTAPGQSNAGQLLKAATGSGSSQA